MLQSKRYSDVDIQQLRDKEERYIIGLMSGTSCDGVDAALVRIKHTGADLALKLISFRSFPYPSELRMRLLAPKMDAQTVCALNVELGELFAKASLRMIGKARDENIEVDFIASSGHTVAHYPPPHEMPGTLQIAESAIIAERCSLPVISNFRPRDMAVGGQGAPLVPYADWVLFNRPDRISAFLNIGGIANIAVVPPDLADVIAFDTGPGNMIIDGAITLLSGGKQVMDEGGAMAAQGEVIDEFLTYLLDHPYFALEPPKSTGREEFGPEIFIRDALASRRVHTPEDLIATITHAVSESIVQAIQLFVLPKFDVEKLIISGGGAHNKTLLKLINKGLPDIKVRRSDHYKIPVDAREAIAFAILGNETLCGTPANVPGATGATRSVVLGQITPA